MIDATSSTALSSDYTATEKLFTDACEDGGRWAAEGDSPAFTIDLGEIKVLKSISLKNV